MRQHTTKDNYFDLADFNDGIARAKQLMNKDFMVVDVETTGIKFDSEIIELAIIGKRGDVLFHSLIKPKNKVSPEAFKIHGIGDAQLVNAPTFAEVADEVHALLSGQVLVAHNAYFDRTKLQYEFGRLNKKLHAQWECSMLLSTPKGGKWPNLDYAMTQFGVIKPAGNPHEALYDAHSCRLLVKVLSQWS